MSVEPILRVVNLLVPTGFPQNNLHKIDCAFGCTFALAIKDKMHIYIPLKGYYHRYITHASSCIKGADIANVSDS